MAVLSVLDHHPYYSSHMMFIVLLIITSLFVLPTSSTSRRYLDHYDHHPTVKNGFRIDLKRVDSNGNFSKLQLVQRGINRGKHRLERLSAMAITSSNDDIKSQVHTGSGEYLMSLSIGTPPMPYSAIMDTGSDLIWTQCKPCSDCYKQPTPIFDPSKSSSFSKLSCTNNLCQALSNSMCYKGGCEYLYAYGDYSTTQGVMASETFTFGNPNSSSSSDDNEQVVSIPKIGFGCGNDNEGSGFTQGAGLVGLGRGPLSLVSQLGTGKFSYCLTSIDNTQTSSLLFGSLANLNTTDGETKTTSLIQNPSQPSFYYLPLEGITVGETLLPIPKSTFQLKADGSGGLIIDSGTTITYLEQSGFKLVKKAFVSQMKLSVADDSSTGLDLCFNLPSDVSELYVPKLIFHFKGADLDLPGNNYMIADSDLGLICLAMGGSSGMSIFGNIQQQNMLVFHDLEKETLSFAPTKCDQL
ncbi:Peptidase A1 [Macleaya cordata]|uniref:Peptidase A1 n=1 Tax=Macleaya cordata TaxID=56857 RepID=A0A200R0B7_MACCD|nr:Peptidase A1 [Macleaya cordata]